MPIVIDEVEITIITPEASSSVGGASNTSASIPNREELVKECVEKVMEILQQKSER